MTMMVTKGAERKNMTITFIGAVILSLMVFGTELSMARSVPALNNEEHKQIAGHRVLKYYTDSNTGVRLGGIGIIFQDRSERYWFGNWFGAYMFDESLNLWKSYTKEGGQLAAREVSMIAQSPDDTLWFAPDSGWLLSNFDGEAWHQMDSKSIGPNVERRISAMFTGHDGRLWIALEDILVAYDRTGWNPVLDLMKEPDGPRQIVQKQSGEKTVHRSDVTIRAALQDKDGCIWLATSKGILRFDHVKPKWRIYSQGKMSNISRGYQDHKSRLWFGDSSGHIYVHNKSTDSWSSYDLIDHLPRSTLIQLKVDPNGNYFLGVTGIYQDRAGRILIATMRGLIVYTESENNWEVFTPENSGLLSDVVTSIVEDHNGRIWIGTGKGLVVLEQ